MKTIAKVISMLICSLSYTLAQEPVEINGYINLNSELKYYEQDQYGGSTTHVLNPGMDLKFIGVELSINKREHRVELLDTETLLHDSEDNSYKPIGLMRAELKSIFFFGMIGEGYVEGSVGDEVSIFATRKNNIVEFSIDLFGADRGKYYIVYEVPEKESLYAITILDWEKMEIYEINGSTEEQKKEEVSIDSRSGQLVCRKGNQTLQLEVPAGSLEEVLELAEQMGFSTSDCKFIPNK